MANKKQLTYKINVETEYKSLDGLVSKLNDIKKNAVSLGLSESEVTRVERLLAAIKNTKDGFGAKMDDNFGIDSSEYAKFAKSMDEIISRAGKVGESLVKMFKVDLQQTIKELDQSIATSRAARRTAGQEKGRATIVFNRASKEAFAEETRGLTRTVIDSAGNETRQPFAKASELKLAAEEIKRMQATGEQLSQDQIQILEAWNRLEQRIAQAIETYNNDWTKAESTLKAEEAKITEFENKRSEAIKTGMQEAFDMPEANKIAFDNYTTSVQELTRAHEANEQQVLENKRAESLRDAGVTSSTKITKENTREVQRATGQQKEYNTTLGKAIYNVVSYGSALTVVRSISTQLINTITEMDKALTGMTVVTSLTREQAWNLTGQLQELAAQTGMTSTEIANMTTMYLQQGETLSNALKLTEAAAKAARIAGISGSESINLLTNAMNGFQMSADQAMLVSDRFAALAAAAATDYEELATALSKVAAQANLAGMSMDFTLGLLTKGIEVTREAPETIGTALKTVISRMRELSDYGKTLEDGVDVNRVDAALKVIGVDLLDANRQFRDLEDVLTEVGEKWDTLTTNQQANVAVALAGTRQQSRLIAMMQDFDRTQELVNISMNSAGATAAQHAKYMQGLEAAMTQLTTAYQKLITNFATSDIVITVINNIASALDFLSENMELVGITLAGVLVYMYPLIKAKAQETLATLANGAATMWDTLTRNDNSKAGKKNTQELKNNSREKRHAKKETQAYTASIKMETNAVKASSKELEKQNKVLNDGQKESANNANKSLGIWGIILAVVVALVAVWWNLNKDTKQGIKLQKQLGNLWKTILNVLKPIFSIVGDVLVILADLLVPIINLLVPLLEYLFGHLKPVISFITLIADVFKGIADFVQDIGKWIDSWQLPESIQNFIDWYFDVMSHGGIVLYGLTKAMDALHEYWMSPEERSAELSAEIEGLQGETYDKKQLKNTLDPLIEEYDKLDSKVVKTSEDIARMKEIEAEIGDLDKETYLNSDGSVKWDVVRKTSEDAATIITNNIKAAYETAFAQIKIGIVDDKTRSAISDYFTQQTLEIENISADAAANITSNFNSIMSAFSDEELIRTSEKELNQLYDAVVNLQKGLDGISSNDKNLLNKQFSEYQKAIQQVPEDAKEAFNSMYSLYASYAQMMSQLNIQGQDAQARFINNMSILGIDASEMESLRQNYLEATGGTDDDFFKWIGSVVNQGGSKTNMVQGLAAMFLGSSPEENKQEMLNAIYSATMLSNQEILEAYTTALSSADNIQELSKKAKAGTITADEIRKFVDDNPDIAEDPEKWEAFWRGEFNKTEYLSKIKQQTREDLQLRLDSARASGNLTEQRALEKELEYLENSEIYSSELWKNMAEITAEMAKQTRLQGQINALEKEYASLTGDEARANLQERIRLYGEMYRDAQKTLNNPLYKQALEAGYVVEGAVVATHEEQLAMSPEMLQFINEYQDIIKQAYDNNEAAIEGYRAVFEMEFEQQKELLETRKESYENYFDSLDALNEQQERTQKREDIIAQLSALAGGFGGNTQNLRKSLLEQLQQVNEEEAAKMREQARNDMIKSIDKHVESIDQKIEEMKTDNIERITAIGIGLGFKMPEYKNGGLVDFTGPAWVDGTPSKPEAFLNASDTLAIRTLLDALAIHMNAAQWEKTETSEETAPATINISEINIHTDELNNEQDFEQAGNALAREFAKIIQERGLNVNVRK